MTQPPEHVEARLPMRSFSPFPIEGGSRLSAGRARRLWSVEIAVFLIALIPRVLSLNAFVTWDEPYWTYGGIRFLTALQEGRLADTLIIGQPAVTTLALTAGQIALRAAFGGPTTATEIRQLGHVAEYDPFDVTLVRRLAVFWQGAPLLVALLTALAVAGIYRLVRRLFDPRTAFVGALFLAWDPFFLAHSRVLALDALLASFMFLSILTLLVAQKPTLSQTSALGPGDGTSFAASQSKLHCIVLSGILAGLAALTKSAGLFLVPFCAGYLFVHAWRGERVSRRARIRAAVQAWLGWVAILVATYVIAWPAMWANPIGTLQETIGTGLFYVHNTSEHTFFFGKAVPAPGPLFYPATFALRITPLTLAGVVLVLCMKSRLSHGIFLLVYAGLFMLLMSILTTKFDRYLLPIFPALDLAAAAGWVAVTQNRRTLTLVTWALIGVQSIYILSFHPYYLSYYNPLVGGGQTAVRVLPVGWGEGMEQAARSLSLKPGAPDLRVAAWGMMGLAPFFPGKLAPLTRIGMLSADYVVVYSDDLQANLPLTHLYHDQVTPEAVIRAHGIDYAWIYPNIRFRVPMAYVESQTQPGDVILVNQPDSAPERYAGTVPLFSIDPEHGESGVAATLNQVAAGRRRLWLLEFTDPELSPDRQGWVRYQLDTHAYRLEDSTQGNVRVTAYRLPDPPTFRAAAPAPLAVDFGGELRLIGADTDSARAAWGRALGVVLDWEAPGNISTDLDAFLYLEDAQGNRWGQGDAPIQDETGRRTGSWPPGMHGQSRHRLQLLAGTPPGRYVLKAGVYVARTGARVGLSAPAPGTALTEVNLGEVEVVQSPMATAVEDLHITHPLDREATPEVELLGYDVGQTAVGPGQSLPLTLFWRARASMHQDYRLQLELRGPDGTLQASDEVLPAGAGYPTSRWRPGEVLRGQYQLRVARTAPGGPANLVAKWVAPGGIVAEWPLAEVMVRKVQRRFDVPNIQNPCYAELGEVATFLGYDLTVQGSKLKIEGLKAQDNNNVRPATLNLQLILYWRAHELIRRNYTVFVHVLDTTGNITVQRDTPPVSGTRPTTGWVPGEVITDSYEIALPAEAEPGEYTIAIGMYDPTTGERLPVHGIVNTEAQDRIMLPARVEIR